MTQRAFTQALTQLKRQHQTLGEVRDRFLDAGLELPLPSETAVLDEYDYEAVLRALVPLIEKEDPASRESSRTEPGRSGRGG